MSIICNLTLKLAIERKNYYPKITKDCANIFRKFGNQVFTFGLFGCIANCMWAAIVSSIVILNLFVNLKHRLLGKLRDLPGQDTDADDTTVQCCGSEPYLSTQAACYNDVITPFNPRKVKSKDAACDTVDSCPSKLPHTCTFSPAKDDCCPFFQCLNSGK